MGMGCSIDADGIGNCTTPDQTAMLQSRVRVHDASSAAEEMFTYGPQEVSHTMLGFFEGWSKDAIESRLSRIVSDDGEDDGESHASMIQIETAALSASEAVGMLASLMNNECPEKDPALLEEAQYQVVQSGFSQDAGIRHVLLQDVVGRLQYMASHQLPSGDHQAMASDPPICSNVGSIATLETEGPGLSADPLGDGGKGSGGSNLLLLTDPLVKSCKELFENTFVENCGGDKPDVKVLTAHRVIINGLKIHMRISVNGHPHHPDCTYEYSTDHTDASFLESNDPAEATKGLVATLKLNVPLCDADDKDGGSDLTDSLLQQFSFGENSLYVGMEHVNDDIPVYSALEVEVPSSLDFRTEYSKCYPALPGMKPGTETVRNQGTCGSCWAFASATSTMANLCITDTANKHSFFKSGDRFEVSVQKIMSCKAKGQSTASGCKGGNMNGFGSEAATWGLTKERDNLYRCGGGNPKKHFQHTTSTCEAFPWAGECTGQANSAWWWGGAARVDGESSMQTFLASGQSMYISIKVYSNFMNVKGDSIYTSTSGSVEGGHAMNCLGYGTESGTKYWIIQNSWGTTGWGDQGYCKFKRGTNLAGIEDGAYAPRVWVTGGKEPPCQDSKSGAGISSTGRAPYIPCNQAKSYCSRSGWPVAKNCPKTCETCTGFNGAGKSSPPSPPPSPGPPPPAPPPPPPPAGKACCRGACQSTSQCASNLFCCPYHHMCMDSSTGSTAGPNCNKCKGNPPAPPPPPSPPGPSPPSPNGCSDLNPSGVRLYGKIATCGQLKRYCKGYSFVRKRCKLTCGQCGGGGGGGNGGGGGAAAKDDPNYKTPFGMTCSQSCKYLKYFSSSLQSTLKSKCKKSCGR
jgi:cathepsin B